MPKKFSSMDQVLQTIKELSAYQYSISKENVRELITAVAQLFKIHLTSAGYPERRIRAIITKFRDAGRRSAPWKPASERVPGRPQDGEDGNRRNRWLFAPSHKFYADEITATLVEVKYYLQTLAMTDAPPLPENSIQHCFDWLVDHPIEPGRYFDPIQMTPIKMPDFINDPRLVQSGHLVPLDRGGRHEPANTFLMLARSNQLQGNLTVEELVNLMDQIVKRHRSLR